MLGLAFRATNLICAATGAVTLAGLGFGVAPYVRERAPMTTSEHDELFIEVGALAGAGGDGAPLTAADALAAVQEGRKPPLTFRDLQQRPFFEAFVAATRMTFSLYADAAGVMTAAEFGCALHKLIDAALGAYGRGGSASGGADTAAARAARAVAARELTERVAGAAFRAIDVNGDGVINASEFASAVLVVLATAQGAAGATADAADAGGGGVACAAIERLVFRVVDADADGHVSEAELAHWLVLAHQHGTLVAGALREPRGPFGLFGMRTLSPERLARKWLRAHDADGDGKLNASEFAPLAPALRVHEVIRRLSRSFADAHLTVAPAAAAAPADDAAAAAPPAGASAKGTVKGADKPK